MRPNLGPPGYIYMYIPDTYIYCITESNELGLLNQVFAAREKQVIKQIKYCIFAFPHFQEHQFRHLFTTFVMILGTK